MAYSDSIRAATCDMNDVASLIDGVLVQTARVNATSLINTTSSSAVLYTGSEVSMTTNSGEIVLALASIALSHSNSGGIGNMSLRIDGTAMTMVTPSVKVGIHGTETGGFTIYQQLFAYTAPAAGSHTYSIYWASNGGTATLYSLQFDLRLFAFQNS